MHQRTSCASAIAVGFCELDKFPILKLAMVAIVLYLYSCKSHKYSIPGESKP